MSSQYNVILQYDHSLFQYFVAILIDKQIIELSKNHKYYLHITDEFKSLYPSINTDINCFEY